MIQRYASRKNLPALTLMCTILSLPSWALAQETELEVDPSRTQVAFTLGDVLHTVHGTFKLKRGSIHFDPASGHAGGLVVVDAASGESGSHARDHKMHKDILESAQYPELSFTPQHVEGQVLPQGEFKVQVQGLLALHGSSHPLTLDVLAHLSGGQLIADTHFPVPYVSWGLKNPSTLFLRVNDTVDIAVHAVGHIKLTAQ